MQIKRVAEGKDLLATKRNEINDVLNKYHDGNSAKRVTDFIIDRYHIGGSER